jgi:alpha-tubulin suppressor-like RCC1 family protein
VVAYQWQRCRSATTGCEEIAGATADRYTVALADAGSSLDVAVTARNDVGARTVVATRTAAAHLGATYAGLGAGLSGACGIVAGGSVACWGSGDTVGDGTPSEPSTPTPGDPYTPQHVGMVSGLTDATAVDGGSFALCALRATGAVACWGHTLQGGGIGNGSTRSSVPVPVAGIATATAVSVGEDTACALLAGGDAACWGSGGDGALGDGTTADHPLPVAVAGLHGALAISTGGAHSCALRSDHTVACWGSDWHGMLAYDPILGPPPGGPMVVVPGLVDVVAIDGGGYFTCALRANGTVSCWGDGTHGEAGDGTMLQSSYVPSTVAGIPDAVAIAVDRFHACALRAGGTVSCWGGSDPGQDDGGLPDSALPVTISGVSGAVAIRAGGDSTYALRPDGSILAWGVGDAHVAHAAPAL